VGEAQTLVGTACCNYKSVFFFHFCKESGPTATWVGNVIYKRIKVCRFYCVCDSGLV